MLEVGGVDVVEGEVDKLVAFGKSPDPETRGRVPSKCIKKVFDHDKKLSEFFQREAFDVKVGLAVDEDFVVGGNRGQ